MRTQSLLYNIRASNGRGYTRDELPEVWASRRLEMQSQNNMVLAMLEQGRALTQQDVLPLGIFRLGARIKDLRDRGYQIETESVSFKHKLTGHKGYCARYRLRVDKVVGE